jgi:hypothetical protein
LPGSVNGCQLASVGRSAIVADDAPFSAGGLPHAANSNGAIHASAFFTTRRFLTSPLDPI